MLERCWAQRHGRLIEPAREAESYLYNALWATYTEDVAQARKASPQTVMAYIDEMPDRLLAWLRSTQTVTIACEALRSGPSSS